MSQPALTELLRARLSSLSPGAEAGPDELDVVLLDVIRAAQRAYPTIDLPLELFVAYLGDRISADVPLPLALRQVHAADLYLACACARGDVRALAAFDERCLRGLDRSLFKMGIAPDMSSEIKQAIRTRVFVGDQGHAEILDYSGRGDLRGWVRVMAIRMALRHKQRARREVLMEDDELLQRIVVSGDLESNHRKSVYRQEFRRAFEGALRALPGRERTILRQHYVDALTIDEIGGLYRVHRSTAARLVARARDLVLEATRARMMAQLGVQTRDLDSIIRMIRSQIEVSLRGLARGRMR